MDNFIKLKKIKFLIEKEKPQSLGSLIETILNDWIRCKKISEKYNKQIKQLLSR